MSLFKGQLVAIVQVGEQTVEIVFEARIKGKKKQLLRFKPKTTHEGNNAPIL